MSRKNTSVTFRPSKPRNHIVRAIISGLISKGSGRHVRAQLKRKQALDRMDLDQRVRESGEW